MLSLWDKFRTTLFFTIGAQKNDGELFSTPEEAEFRCASFWRGLGGSIPSYKSHLSKRNNVSRSCISNFNMNNVLNGPLVGAPELLIDKFCVTYRPGSNGTTPGPQNNKQKHISGVGSMGRNLGNFLLGVDRPGAALNENSGS